MQKNRDDHEQSRRPARQDGCSQAEIARDAITALAAQQAAPRSFALTGAWQGDGTSVADVPEDELLRGFAD